jgi:hypothetical protein
MSRVQSDSLAGRTEFIIVNDAKLDSTVYFATLSRCRLARFAPLPSVCDSSCLAGCSSRECRAEGNRLQHLLYSSHLRIFKHMYSPSSVVISNLLRDLY